MKETHPDVPALDGEAKNEHPFRATSPRLVALALAALGVAALGAGAAAVFATEKETGATALLAVGAGLVALAAIGDRLKTLRFREFEIELSLRERADEAERRGDKATARDLRRAADRIAGRAAQVAGGYASLRSSLPAGRERTERMEEFFRRARADAYLDELDREDVLRRLSCGSEGQRVWALGVLTEKPELATTRAVLEAIQLPEDMFDLYRALVLGQALMNCAKVATWHKERIVDAVSAELEGGRFGSDKDCLRIASAIIDLDPRRRHSPSD